MPKFLRRWLYTLFLWPSLKDSNTDPSTTHNTMNPEMPHTPNIKALTHRVKRPFVMLRVHVGELGHVKAVTVRMSCGSPTVDQMAIKEVQGKVFPTPRVGHKAVAQWHNMRWEVPDQLK